MTFRPRQVLKASALNNAIAKRDAELAEAVAADAAAAEAKAAEAASSASDATDRVAEAESFSDAAASSATAAAASAASAATAGATAGAAAGATAGAAAGLAAAEPSALAASASATAAASSASAASSSADAASNSATAAADSATDAASSAAAAASSVSDASDHADAAEASAVTAAASAAEAATAGAAAGETAGASAGATAGAAAGAAAAEPFADAAAASASAAEASAIAAEASAIAAAPYVTAAEAAAAAADASATAAAASTSAAEAASGAAAGWQSDAAASAGTAATQAQAASVSASAAAASATAAATSATAADADAVSAAASASSSDTARIAAEAASDAASASEAAAAASAVSAAAIVPDLEADIAAIPAVPQDIGAVGGLTDRIVAVDPATGRSWLRAGLRHLMLSGMKILHPSGGPWTLDGPYGALISQPATGRATFSGARATQGVFPGAALIIEWANSRISAFRIDPVDGALRLIGWSAGAGGATADFTEAEMAAYAAEAEDYADRVRRQFVQLHQPTDGLVLFLSFGQSLAVGAEGWPTLTRTAPSSECLMMGLSVHAAAENVAAWNPIGGATTLAPLVATAPNSGRTAILTPVEEAALTFGDSTRGETMLEGFAAQFRPAWLASRGKTSDANNRFVFAAAGDGGETIAELSVGASPELFQRFRDAIIKAKAEATSAGVTFSVGAVLFTQGESDYVVGTSYAAYLAALTTLIADMRAYVATQCTLNGVLPIYITQTGGQWAVDTLDLAVARAQIEAARTIPGVYIVAGNAAVTDKGGHLSSNGYRWIGCKVGQAAARTIIDGEGWECTRPTRWVVRGTTLVGVFQAPVAPLRFAAAYTGFTASAAASGTSRAIYAADDNGEVTLSDVRIVRDRLVVATLSRAAVGTLKVWLGRLAGGVSGAVGIADSDTARLVYSYEYDAGSGQTVAEDIEALTGMAYPPANWTLADVQSAVAV